MEQEQNYEQTKKRNRRLLIAGVATVLLVTATVIYVKSRPEQNVTSEISANTSTTSSTLGDQTLTLGQRTKTDGCQAHLGLPDLACSPGAIIETATMEQICKPGYSKTVRDVPESLKLKVYKEYGITSHKVGEYEVDHLVSLELGGSNDISNLWPELAEPKPGFHEKDKVENYLHTQVCLGKIALKEAQIQEANNWLTIYNLMPSK